MRRFHYRAPLFFTIFLVSFCGQFKTLSRADLLNPEEKLEYLILKSLDPDAAKQYLTLASSQSRADYRNWFWQNRSGTEHAIYLARANKAKELFGSIDLLNDERVITYIRYGPPRREEYMPKPLTTDTGTIFVNPAEIWTYDSLGIQIDFVKTGTGFRQVGQSRFGRNWFPPALEPVDYGKPPPPPPPDYRPLNFALALYRLSQHNDSVVVEIHYGIARNDPALISGKQNLFYIELKLNSRRYSTVSKGWFGCTPDSQVSFVVGRQTLILPVDIYSVTATATTLDGKNRAEINKELNLIDYVRRTQPCSDIIFYTLVDSTFQSPQFERGDWRRVVPLLPLEIKTGSTCYLLYEIYNLTVDSLNQHRIEATYEIVDLTTKQAVVIPTPTRFIAGTGTTGTAVERLHTMDLKPGEYLIIARVRDLNSGKTVSLTARIRLKPDRTH